MDKLQFVYSYSLFFIFLTQIIGLMSQNLGVSNLNNFPSLDVPTTAPNSVLAGAYTTTIIFFNNIVFFFSLMSISSSWFLFGAIIITPFIIGLSWSLLEILKDLIPLT